MFYIVYDADGEIRKSGVCAAADFSHQGDPAFMLEGIGSFETHYVKDGVLTSYTPEQKAAKMQRNNDPAKNWSNTSMAYV